MQRLAESSQKQSSTEDGIRHIHHDDFVNLSDEQLRYRIDGQSIYESSDTGDSQRLSQEGEFFLFRKMNYLLWLADRELRLNGMSADVQVHLDDAASIRNHIVECNLGLVRALARRFANNDDDFGELLSEGSEILIKAIGLFDIARGFRFSTYATHAVQRHLCRVIKRRSRRTNTELRTDSEILSQVASEQPDEAIAVWIENEERLRTLIASMEEHLDEREHHVVANRFGLNAEGLAKSFREIGDELGLSKERTRQLQASAIQKLRTVFQSLEGSLPEIASA